MYHIIVLPCSSSSVPPGGGAGVQSSSGRHARYKIVALGSVVQVEESSLKGGEGYATCVHGCACIYVNYINSFAVTDILA